VGTIEYDDEASRYLVDPDGAGARRPVLLPEPDFTTGALRGTAVLRWEYRPGSTSFFVWTQQRSGYDPPGTFDLQGARTAIFGHCGPQNIFQVKLTLLDWAVGSRRAPFESWAP
jgi:hypothetical protein